MYLILKVVPRSDMDMENVELRIGIAWPYIVVQVKQCIHLCVHFYASVALVR